MKPADGEKMISVEEWRASRYKNPPCLSTVWRWIRDGKIVPTPVKHGRRYYLSPTAEYCDPLVSRVLRR